MSTYEENPSVPSELNNHEHTTSEHSAPELSTSQPIQPQVAQLAGQDFLSPLPVPNPPNATSATSSSPPKTLWMGDLDPWSDEESVINLWGSLGKRVLVKLIKAKKGTPAATLNTGHAGYCFIEFETYDDAKSALSLNGSQIPNTNRSFRLNWASSATLSAPVAQSPEYSLFVGDLSPSTTEAHLLALFQAHFKSVKTVRVMTDPITGTSRCFGFVRFSDEEERRRALTEMSGVWCAGRPLRVALATPRNTLVGNGNNLGLFNGIPNSQQGQFQGGGFNQFQQSSIPGGPGVGVNNDVLLYQYQQIPPPLQFYHPDQQLGPPPQSNSAQSPNGQFPPGSTGSSSIPLVDGPSSIPFSDPNNTTVFVGGLATGIPEQTLAALFQPFGPILHVKIPTGKGCGFIRFEKREDAEAAIAGMQGFQIGSSRVRLSWGRQQNQQRLQLAALAMGGHPVGPGLGSNPNIPGGVISPPGYITDDIAISNLSNGLNDLSFDQVGSNGYSNQPILAGAPVNNLYYLPGTAGSDAYQGYDQGPYHQDSIESPTNEDETGSVRNNGSTPDSAKQGDSNENGNEGTKLQEMYRAAVAGKLDSLN